MTAQTLASALPAGLKKPALKGAAAKGRGATKGLPPMPSDPAPDDAPEPGAKGAPVSVAAMGTPNTQKPGTAKVQIPIQADPAERRAFKVYCAERDISMSEQFARMFAFWKAHNT